MKSVGSKLHGFLFFTCGKQKQKNKQSNPCDAMNQQAFSIIFFTKKLPNKMIHKINQANRDKQIHQRDAHIGIFSIAREKFVANPCR